jgi:hypothetical protein
MIVRKISVGPDYMKCMHYVVGQPVLDKTYNIQDIIQDINGNIDIYVVKNGEIVKWKTFNSTIPVTIEYKIDF